VGRRQDDDSCWAVGSYVWAVALGEPEWDSHDSEAETQP
jgi:hypothetical protein